MASKQQYVIIIDDDAFMVKLVAKLVAKLGFVPVTCTAVEQALDIPVSKNVSHIITDIFMPGMGGIEGIQFLRESYPKARIIAMTGGWENMEPDKVLAAAEKIGADTGMKKPITLDALGAALGS